LSSLSIWGFITRYARSAIDAHYCRHAWDQTGEELLAEALRVLHSAVIRQPLQFIDYDLSLETRRKTENQVVGEAAAATCKTGLALKAATITPEIAGDVAAPMPFCERHWALR
jgi:isocitrate dehydrogenase